MIGLRTLSWRWKALLALAVVSLAVPALAGEDPAPAAGDEQAVAQAPDDAGQAALRAAVAELLNHSDEGLVEVVLPDGSVMIELEGRFQHVVVAQMGPDGSWHVGCLSSLPEDPDAPLVSPPPEAAAGAVAE